MDLQQQCFESFLDSVIDVYIYPAQGATLPIPYSVPQIMKMENCAFPDCVLHISSHDGNADVLCEVITAKSSMAQEAYGTIYTFDVSANAEIGIENVRSAYKNIEGKDCYIVLKTADSGFYLCYTVPATFFLKDAVTLSTSARQSSHTLTTKAMSPFIPITIS